MTGKRFLLTYEGSDDPKPADVKALQRSLGPLSAVEVVPGTVRVEGDVEEIKRRAAKLDHWVLSEEKFFRR